MAGPRSKTTVDHRLGSVGASGGIPNHTEPSWGTFSHDQGLAAVPSPVAEITSRGKYRERQDQKSP